MAIHYRMTGKIRTEVCPIRELCVCVCVNTQLFMSSSFLCAVKHMGGPDWRGGIDKSDIKPDTP